MEIVGRYLILKKYYMLLQDILFKLIEWPSSLDRLRELKNTFSSENKLSDLPSNIQLLQEYRRLVEFWEILPNKWLEELLKKRAIRSKSGIVAVQVLTKPFWCPGKCVFCPNDPTMPKSYIKTEPGAARALMNQFDPYKQVYNRLTSLTLTGHSTDKIEMIVLWGTWDVYPQDYKVEFIKGLYDACNTFSQLKIISKDISWITSPEERRFSYILEWLEKIAYSKTIQEAIQINETADHRIIGLTVETRPEYVTDENCLFWRDIGVTRLEMGVQSMYNEVLDANKRGHSVNEIRQACHRLRQYGFKFSIHIMPGLYQSTYEKDLWTFQQIYADKFLLPDEIKFYPTSVIPNTELYELYKQWKYQPLETNQIKSLIKETFLNIIPPYTRIKRLIRDIPATEIEAGSKTTNLAQIVHEELKSKMKENISEFQQFLSRLYGDYKVFLHFDEWLKSPERNNFVGIVWQKLDNNSLRNFVCLDTRSREVRNRGEGKAKQLNLVIRPYLSSVGQEYFISWEDELWYIYGFTRLLLPLAANAVDEQWLGKETALIRELHVYGDLESLDKKAIFSEDEKVQHSWLGKQLMYVAEQISQISDYKKLSVISGVWVREYYRKLGYHLEGTYMVKSL